MKKARTKKRPIKRSKKKKLLKKKRIVKKPQKTIKKPVKKKAVRKAKKTRKKAVKKSKKKAVRKRVIKKKSRPTTKSRGRGSSIPRRKSKVSGPVKKAKKRKAAKPKKRRIVKKRISRKKAVKKLKKKVVKKRVIKKAKKKVMKKPRKRAAKKIRKPKKRTKKRVPRKKKVVKRRRKRVRVIKRTYSGGGSLEQLFESPIKVQIMKLFFRNPDENFLLKEAAKTMRNSLASVRREMKRLEKTGLLKSRQISSRKQVFAVNPNFDFFNELRELILKASPVSKAKMLKAIKGLGKIKLVLLSGLFVGNNTARADLLIVGDNINQRKLNTFIKNLEAEAGTDINCVVMTTEEFSYRYDMYDRFVRDLLNEKCEFLINRLGL